MLQHIELNRLISGIELNQIVFFGESLSLLTKTPGPVKMLFFVDLCGPREPCVMWGPGSPDWKGAVLQGHNWACIYLPVVNILSLTGQQQCGFCCCC